MRNIYNSVCGGGKAIVRRRYVGGVCITVLTFSPAHPLPPTTQVSQLQGRVDYFQKLCGEAQKGVEEWRNK